jgi:RNA polymerase sigma-70 factor, ECF subfamily
MSAIAATRNCLTAKYPKFESAMMTALSKMSVQPEESPRDELLERLVTRAQKGNQTAATEIYSRFQKVVYAIALSYTSTHEAADIVQEVFATMIQRIHDVQDPSAFAGWLTTIARRKSIDAYRKRRANVPFDEESPVEIAESSEPASASTTAAARQALQAIRSLPATYREPLIMRLVEGMTGPEISVRTGLTEGSVRVTLHRGMELLRAALKVPTL